MRSNGAGKRNSTITDHAQPELISSIAKFARSKNHMGSHNGCIYPEGNLIVSMEGLSGVTGSVFCIVAGVAVLAGAFFGEDFFDADELSGTGFNRRTSRASGRAVFCIAGGGFLIAGIRMLLSR